ncbi:MAG: alpha/beta hydrolase [Aquificota bacterium]|nr:MAG: alpha/beta hydrolase [Aquificota bacterium]
MFIYERTNPELILIHLHGFASDVKGSKTEVLRQRATEGRFSFFAMDMDYHTTTTTKTLEVLDALVKGFSQKFEKVWLSGSSHGGYVALNYIRFYEAKGVERLYLFAPSYSTLSLTLRELGEERCKNWIEGKEELRFYDCNVGIEISINKDFARDIVDKGYEIIKGQEVYFPQEPKVELLVFHGNKDDVVPVESSRLFVSKVKVKLYLELEDDHRLSANFGRLVKEYM